KVGLRLCETQQSGCRGRNGDRIITLSINLSLLTELFMASSKTPLRKEKWRIWRDGEKRIKNAVGWYSFSDSPFLFFVALPATTTLLA
ncbi:MAG: hypothetical protein AAB332_02400, partial [Planctomycetota bacterium]